MKKELIVLEWLQNSGISDIIMKKDKTVSVSSALSDISDLSVLKQSMSLVDCRLKDTASNMVFSRGNPSANIMFIGEAPGAEEDKQGLPFVGQSGMLLDKVINAIGLSGEDIYITNTIPWRPPGNRTPTDAEIGAYRPYLIRHIEIIKPKLIVCLGSSAARALLQKNVYLSQVRGNFLDGRNILNINFNLDILITFHPAYLLRSPSQKREFWKDFLKITAKLRENT